MNLSQRLPHFFGRETLAATVALGFAVFGAAPNLRADRYEECHRRITKADHRLHEAIEHHGYRSEQAERARHNLREAREHCWSTYHRWWDEDEHRWRTERDWRDEDHEHYRDRP
jgi:hypothetical protein